MRTFFHPPAIIRDEALLPKAARKVTATVSGLIATTAPHARSLLSFAARHPKAALLTTGATLSLLAPILGASNGMPGLAKSDRKELPAAASEAAREVFDTRFAEHRGSHYTIVVTCAPNIMPEMSKIRLFGGSGESRTKAPMLARMELVEIEKP